MQLLGHGWLQVSAKLFFFNNLNKFTLFKIFRHYAFFKLFKNHFI